jgi:predicted HicB family RNase H-like nuclease
VARAPELPGCLAEGATRAEAIARLEEEMSAQVHNIRQAGGDPPRPVDDGGFSGELAIKVTPTLHRDLVWQSRDEGVPLEQLLTEMLTRALDGRGRGHGRPADGAPRGDRMGQGYGQRYHSVMEDRANFIEYVRGLESGGRGMGGGGGGGGGGRGRPRRRPASRPRPVVPPPTWPAPR